MPALVASLDMPRQTQPLLLLIALFVFDENLMLRDCDSDFGEHVVGHPIQSTHLGCSCGTVAAFGWSLPSRIWKASATAN